jgi:hypothetical protein
VFVVVLPAVLGLSHDDRPAVVEFIAAAAVPDNQCLTVTAGGKDH